MSSMAAYFYKFVPLGFKVEHMSDETWEYDEEPHASRRREILEKYPQVKKLMGYDPIIAVIVVAEVSIQLLLCWLMRDASWPFLLVSAYLISGTINHSLGAAIHEIGHNLAFGHTRPNWNRVLGMLANIPMVVPLSVTYKRFHNDHHRFLGHDVLDVDIPTWVEAKFIRHPLTRFFWLIIHPALHGLRPYLKNPKPPSQLEIINLVYQLSFDFAVWYFLGTKSFCYLFLGTMFGLGVHPLAGHFISEHYLFTKGQATHSYYGTGNIPMFNLGFHVEHHDFPYIPFRKLPELKRMLPEYYDNLPYHTSWCRVLWDFVFHPDLGPQSHGVGYLRSNEDGHAKPFGDSDINSNQAKGRTGSETKKTD